MIQYENQIEKDSEFLLRDNKKLFLPSSNFGWALWFAWDNSDESGNILWVNFRIIDVMYVENDKPYYTTDACLQPTDDPKEAEIVVHGFIKWDGCCQWWAECAHTDDVNNLKELCEVIQSVYKEAKEIFTSANY
jgi:hypothetical protein